MPNKIIAVDLNKTPVEQRDVLHNRWHPDIPMVAKVKPGDEFRIESIDWTGGQIKNDDDASDVRDVDLTKVHYLSGPVAVEGAEPGDLLVVDILDIGALEGSEWGFTGIFAKQNGGGFLTDHFPNAAKACWDFNGIYASTRHVPRLSFASLIHIGLIGCLPSRSLLETWNRRESELVASDPQRVPPLAALPYAETAVMGRMNSEAAITAAAEAARTVPPREHGGNCDIKELTKGSRVYFPVYVKEAGLSLGDLHFSQGDGEITFCGAIEMAGYVDLRVNLIKQGVASYGITNPIFKPSPLMPRHEDFLIFEGISVDETGKQHYLDAHIAYRRACLNAINYMMKFGYSFEQAYTVLGTAPVHAHISGIVDIPNVCATLWLPTEIFDFDIRPGTQGPLSAVDGSIKLPVA